MGLISFLCLCIHSERSVWGKPFRSDNRIVDGRKFATSAHPEQAHTHWHAYAPCPLGSVLREWMRSRTGGRAKHVNCATPTATNVFQHCTSGQGVLNRQLHSHNLLRVQHTPDMLLLLRTFFRQPSRICCHQNRFGISCMHDRDKVGFEENKDQNVHTQRNPINPINLINLH